MHKGQPRLPWCLDSHGPGLSRLVDDIVNLGPAIADTCFYSRDGRGPADRYPSQRRTAYSRSLTSCSNAWTGFECHYDRRMPSAT